MTTDVSGFWASGSVPLIEPEFLGSIISAASDIALVVSASGSIQSVLVNDNSDLAGTLKHWEGKPVTEVLTSESVEKFETARDAYKLGRPVPRPIELNHADGASWQYPVRYTFHRFGAEGSVLMLGRDLRSIAETQQHLVQAQIALERGYETQREYDARLKALMTQVSDAVVFVSLATGDIEEHNALASSVVGLKGDALRGSKFESLFRKGSARDLMERLEMLAQTPEPSSLKVVAARGGQALMLHPFVFRAGGRRLLICRMIPVTVEAGPSVERDEDHGAALFRLGTDPMLFVDRAGAIQSVNEAFLDLVGAVSPAAIAGDSIVRFLARGEIDLGLILSAGDHTPQVKTCHLHLVNTYGGKIQAEVSITPLDGQNSESLGLVLRDRNRFARHGDGSAAPAAIPDGTEHVAELVGSATIKEIVAETTDVVERMCIETAIRMTQNNRVAAAEMLGLSRQSLYVKLRKFGLIARSD